MSVTTTTPEVPQGDVLPFEATGTQAQVAQLAGKLLAVMKAVPFIEKRGWNDHQSYNFAQAVDVVRDVRAAIIAQGLFLLPSVIPGSLQHFTETGGRSFVTTVDFRYLFIDTETGATLTMTWAGAGSDTGGDKGLYKAMTGGLKYGFLDAFLLPTTNDPEFDGLTYNGPPPAEAAAAAPAAAPAAAEPESTVAQDAERPAATVIPSDRARAILTQAIGVGIARIEDGRPVFEPVLKAKLGEVGVTRIGELNVDQAEDVERFLEMEAAAQ